MPKSITESREVEALVCLLILSHIQTCAACICFCNSNRTDRMISPLTQRATPPPQHRTPRYPPLPITRHHPLLRNPSSPRSLPVRPLRPRPRGPSPWASERSAGDIGDGAGLLFRITGRIHHRPSTSGWRSQNLAPGWNSEAVVGPDW